MTRTITEDTSRGTIKYKVVDCTSCENEVVKTEARRMMIVEPGGFKRDKSWNRHQEWEVYHNKYATGWVCPHCAKDPASYPQTAGEVRTSTIAMSCVWLIGVIGLGAAGALGMPVWAAFFTGLVFVTAVHMIGRAIVGAATE